MKIEAGRLGSNGEVNAERHWYRSGGARPGQVAYVQRQWADGSSAIAAVRRVGICVQFEWMPCAGFPDWDHGAKHDDWYE